MLLLLIGLILYFTLYPFQPYTFHYMKTDKISYCRGEKVTITISFRKNMNVQPSIKWFIVDGTVLPLDDIEVITLPLGENKVLSYKKVPESILTGMYRFRLEQAPIVHPLHSPILYTWNTNEFEVKDCGGNFQ